MASRSNKKSVSQSPIEAALSGMPPEELREIIYEAAAMLSDSNMARLEDSIFDRATRNSSGWRPVPPPREEVEEVDAFVKKSEARGYADPRDVDHYLGTGATAFRAKDYPIAQRILGAILTALADCGFDLGQDEMYEEVLGMDLTTCAAQYVVAVYMSDEPATRPQSVFDAINKVQGVAYFHEPLQQIEEAAIGRLPGFKGFVEQWRKLIESLPPQPRQSNWDTDTDRWLREVVQRTEGTNGLAQLARQTRRVEDLSAWCTTLADAKEWKLALAAYEEAAQILPEGDYHRGQFLDGAALSAQELSSKTLATRLEQAWREAPSEVRLRRWLGSSTSPKTIRARATSALAAPVKTDARQQALLHLLLAEHGAAAKLLAAAPGLGWSHGDHPGHMLFTAYTSFFTGDPIDSTLPRSLDELSLLAGHDGPRLATPDVASLLKIAQALPPIVEKDRQAVLDAMHKAAEKRIEGVTQNQRRNHYAHAATLAHMCLRVDPAGSASWFNQIRDQYSRYSALRRELDSPTKSRGGLRR